MNAWQSQARPGQFDITKGKYVGYQPGSYSATRPLTPDQEAAAAQQRAREAAARAGQRTPTVGDYARGGWGGVRGALAGL